MADLGAFTMQYVDPGNTNHLSRRPFAVPSPYTHKYGLLRNPISFMRVLPAPEVLVFTLYAYHGILSHP